MKLFSTDIVIYGTVYIKAETAEAANKAARELQHTALELFEQDGEIPISGKQYDDPDLPDVSLSPAMTVALPTGDIEEDEYEEIPS